MPIEITKRIEIDAGHRLQRHESKCANVHGHRYAFEFTITSPDLDKVGRVIDFGKVKEILGTWLDENWDHAMIVEDTDLLVNWLAYNRQKYFVVPFPPTAENLALFMLRQAAAMLPEGLTVQRVRVYETPTCWADATVQPPSS